MTHVTILHELVGNLEEHRSGPHQTVKKQSFLVGLLRSKRRDTELQVKHSDMLVPVTVTILQSCSCIGTVEECRADTVRSEPKRVQG